MKCFQVLKRDGGCEQAEFSKHNISVHLSGTHVRAAILFILEHNILFFCYIFNFLLSVLTPYATMADVMLILCRIAEVVGITENIKESASNCQSIIKKIKFQLSYKYRVNVSRTYLINIQGNQYEDKPGSKDE